MRCWGKRVWHYFRTRRRQLALFGLIALGIWFVSSRVDAWLLERKYHLSEHAVQEFSTVKQDYASIAARLMQTLAGTGEQGAELKVTVRLDELDRTEEEKTCLDLWILSEDGQYRCVDWELTEKERESLWAIGDSLFSRGTLLLNATENDVCFRRGGLVEYETSYVVLYSVNGKKPDVRTYEGDFPLCLVNVSDQVYEYKLSGNWYGCAYIPYDPHSPYPTYQWCFFYNETVRAVLRVLYWSVLALVLFLAYYFHVEIGKGRLSWKE